MQDNRGNLFTRNDTMLGVCEALGQDFGFNPQFLRAALAVLLIPFPVQVIASYVTAGIVVAIARFVFPVSRHAAAAPATPIALASETKPAQPAAQVELAAAA
jgi:phage shock protein PspC (stress-responsive transcriptional regulator)